MMRLLACCLGLLIAISSAQAGSVDARLIRGSKTAREADPALKEILPKLKKIFGFENFQQLGKDTQPIKGHDVVKMNIGEGFTVFCYPKAADSKIHEMDIEIYSGKTMLVKQQGAKLKDDRFIFIKGPEVGSDWIIIAVRVVE